MVLFSFGCKYHGLHLDLLIGFVCFATAGRREYLLCGAHPPLTALNLLGRPRGTACSRVFTLAPPPPLTALNLLDRPRGTACSARSCIAVPNLRRPRCEVVQTKTIVLYRLRWAYQAAGRKEQITHHNNY